MGAETPGIDPALMARDVVSFVIDSREIQAGDVFFALSQPEYKDNGFNGDFDDATSYVRSSFDKGAIAAVVRRDRFEEHRAELEPFEDRLIFVDDSIAALQSLAHNVYLNWNQPVVAITGSAGKTTAKELTAHVLEASGRKVLKNIKNYNNGLGHPLTVLNLAKDPSYDIAVLEMGMSTPLHEIARLCKITPPDVSVVLNVLPVHVEHLGSFENVAAAKAEIVEGMKDDGVAVLNADDPRVLEMGELAKDDVMTYGIDADWADVTAKDIKHSGFGLSSFTLHTREGDSKISFPLNGRHNILNALAAATVGLFYGMSAKEVGECLRTVTPPPQRGEVIHFAKGFTVINDSYNSNPAALLSMVDTLVEGSEGAKRRIVVAGEMLELGDDAERLHAETGAKIASKNVDMLMGVRGLGKALVDGAADAGLSNATFVADSTTAGEMLANEIREGDVVLVKGSRGVRTEKVIEKLLEKFDAERSAAVQR
ncbi:MAG TPA: UDP-N-acetylmuramoyl-tripeptide--D-alanyl-D-alanine ligase [Pyrinomonadaceae bacterium]|nr:UDP-N-acetylmuramoyl-tripeptide--D-alanyl-D-alanine ligase [Pyrinomonadaceae bacterium]